MPLNARRRPLSALLLLLPLLGGLATSAPPVGAPTGPPTGQPTTPPTAPAASSPQPAAPAPPPSVESLRAQRDELATRKDLDEATRGAALAALDRALQRAAAIVEWDDRRTRTEQSRQAMAGELEQIKTELAQAKEAERGAAPDAVLGPETATELAQKRDEADAALKLAKERLAELDRELQQRSERLAALPGELAATSAELDDLIRPSEAAAVAETHPAVAAAERVDRAVRTAELQSKLDALRAESAALQARSELDLLRRERAAKRVAAREADSKRALELIQMHSARTAEQEALAAKRDAADGAAPVRAVSQRTLELVEQRTGPEGLIARNNSTRARLQRLVQRLPVLTAEYERERLRAAASGNSGLTTARLRLQRAELPDVRSLEAALSRAREELFTTQRQHAELDAEIAALPPPETQRDDLLLELEQQAPAPLPEALRSEISAELDRRIAEQRRQFELLQAAYTERTEMLFRAIEWVPPAIALTEQFSSFIDRRILWIRSVEPIGAGDPARAWSSLQKFGGRAWESIQKGQFRRAVATESAWLSLAAVAALAWLSSRRWRRGRYDEWASQVGRISTDGMLPTIKATLLCAAEALVWPGLVLFAAHRLALVAEPGSALETCIVGVRRAASAMLVITPILAVVRTHGLAQSHFRWRDETRRLLRRTLRLVALLVLPCVAIVTATEWDSKDAGADTVGRVAFMVGNVVVAFGLARLLHPERGVLAATYARSNNGWTRRLAPLWRLLLLATPLSLALLAGLGWYYTALQLERRLYSSIVLVIVLVVVHALITRWLLLSRRRLALAELRREREARAAEAEARAAREAAARAVESTGPVDSSGARESLAAGEPPRESGQASSAEGGSVPVDDDSLDIQSVDVQSRQLLRTAVTFALLLGLWAIWAAVLPALGGLNRFEIWPTFGQVRQTSDLPPSAAQILARYGRGAEALAGLTSWPTGAATSALGVASSQGGAATPVVVGAAPTSDPAAPASGTQGGAPKVVSPPTPSQSAGDAAAAVNTPGQGSQTPPAATPPATTATSTGASPVTPSAASAAAATPPPSPLPSVGLSQFAPISGATTPDPAVPSPDDGALTLGNLFAALLILIATIAVARNITGVLELAILQRLPIENSARYATTTLVRYLVWGVGIAAAFGAVGIGWSKVQWLVAAASVGIGFGLQEIVANFICGIIILFERPIRVGDTVTIGGMSGTVSRIRIRATTITDWDRKELIIPNKSIITGEVLNWTLSDANLRLVIAVGVDYGADPELVARILREVADATPFVVKDPPPNAVFVGFGESTLNFELRCILPSIENLVGARHALHMAIIKRFREHGVSIAFPQRDVHVQGTLELSGRRSAERRDR